MVGASPGHQHVFFVHADSGVHRLAPECKLVATVLFVFAVVATPREAIWAFGLDALVLLAVEVWFLTLSQPGLWGAWNIVVKGTLGVAATALLTATTTIPELLRALERLRLPRPLVGIASFMIRYGEVLTDDLRRMRIARLSRGDDPRWLWQVAGLAKTAGALFVRSYERGERVYIAMLARGYGLAPAFSDDDRAPRRGWATALTAPIAAAVICVTALALT
jgi:cobalt/nickel transport system permease protein